MKKLLLSLFIAIIAIVVQSCNDKIELAKDFKETAVVYGILDQSDSVHMIKITRAFIGPGNSLEIAQVPDSSYFDAIDAEIREYVSGTLQRTWTLKDTIIENKETNGIFYAPEQKVYVMYSKSIDNSDSPLGSALNPNAIYKLHIDVNNGEFQIDSETELVSGITSSTSGSYSFDFVKSTGEITNENITIGTGNSFLINTSLIIHYTEFIGTDSTWHEKEWGLGEFEVEPNSTKIFTGYGQTFYEQVVIATANANPLVEKRNFEGITTKVVAGAEDLYNYILVNQPSSSLAQNKPSFTNLVVSDPDERSVIGIFSSRYTFTTFQPMKNPLSQSLRGLGKASTERLCTGPETGLLLFCSQHDQDILQNQSWACN